MKLHAVVLAAGKGSRLRLNSGTVTAPVPKPLQQICGTSMLCCTIEAIKHLQYASLNVVYNQHLDLFKKDLEHTNLDDSNINWVLQENLNGTATAAIRACSYIESSCVDQDNDDLVLIVPSDMPLISKQTYKNLLDKYLEVTTKQFQSNYADNIAVLSSNLTDANTECDFGLIVKDKHGVIKAVIEHSEYATDQTQNNNSDNSDKSVSKQYYLGVIIAKLAVFKKLLPLIQNNNSKNEYYLTDVISIAYSMNYNIFNVEVINNTEICGVNTITQLAIANEIAKQNKVNCLLENSVSILDPKTLYIIGNCEIQGNVKIFNNVYLENVKIGQNTIIHSNCVIKNSDIGSNTCIYSNTVVDNAIILDNAVIGPFAHIRPHTKVKNSAKIGNFVEVKNSIIAKNTKISHMTYIGDAVIGENVNIGAGTITCNYDGRKKNRTLIGNNVFIGSNTSLIAPIEIADNVIVGAGTVMTRNALPNTLVLSRKKQKNITLNKYFFIKKFKKCFRKIYAYFY